MKNENQPAQVAWLVKPPVIVTIIGCVLILIALFSHWLDPKPIYRGRTVEGWLAQRDQTAAMRAFEAMGRAAVPELISALDKKPSRANQFYQWIYFRIPGTLRRRLPAPVDVQAIRGFASLALAANDYTASFVPDLIVLLQHPDPTVRNAVGLVVSHQIGPTHSQWLPVLRTTFQKGTPQLQVLMAQSLARLGSAARSAVPDLQAALSSSDFNVRAAANLALASIEPLPPPEANAQSH